MKPPKAIYYITYPQFAYRGRPYANGGHVSLKLQHSAHDCIIEEYLFIDNSRYVVNTYTYEEWTQRHA